MNLGSELKAARKRRGLTQGQLGRAFGFTQAFVAEIETGAKTVPPELAPMLRRFISTGRLPTSDEIAARRTHHRGK